MATIEQRILSTANLRAMSQGDEMQLVGYAARFGVRSHDLGGFREQIAPGAFKRSLDANDDVIATFNHDPDKVLGRKRSGTLRLAEDVKGLAFRVQLDKNQQSHCDLHAAVKRGDISDCSFAFSVDGDDGDSFDNGFDDDGQRCMIRTLRSVKLMDVAVVTHPAYPDTSVTARAHYDGVSKVLPTPAVLPPAMRKAKFARDYAHARALFKRFPRHSLENITSRMKIYGDTTACEDALNQIRLNAITRVGVGFEVEPMRYQGGQAEDPEVKLRDKEAFNWDDSDDWAEDEHDRCAQFHRNCARQAKSMAACSNHHRCADLHEHASTTGDLVDSHAARQASKRLLESQVS